MVQKKKLNKKQLQLLQQLQTDEDLQRLWRVLISDAIDNALFENPPTDELTLHKAATGEFKEISKAPVPSRISKAPSAISKAPSAISKAPSAISKAPSAISKAPSAISKVPSAISDISRSSYVERAPSGVDRAPSGVELALSALEKEPSGVEIALSAVDRASSTVENVPSTISKTATVYSKTNTEISQSPSISRAPSAISTKLSEKIAKSFSLKAVEQKRFSRKQKKQLEALSKESSLATLWRVMFSPAFIQVLCDDYTGVPLPAVPTTDSDYSRDIPISLSQRSILKPSASEIAAEDPEFISAILKSRSSLGAIAENEEIATARSTASSGSRGINGIASSPSAKSSSHGTDFISAMLKSRSSLGAINETGEIETAKSTATSGSRSLHGIASIPSSKSSSRGLVSTASRLAEELVNMRLGKTRGIDQVPSTSSAGYRYNGSESFLADEIIPGEVSNGTFGCDSFIEVAPISSAKSNVSLRSRGMATNDSNYEDEIHSAPSRASIGSHAFVPRGISTQDSNVSDCGDALLFTRSRASIGSHAFVPRGISTQDSYVSESGEALLSTRSRASIGSHAFVPRGISAKDSYVSESGNALLSNRSRASIGSHAILGNMSNISAVSQKEVMQRALEDDAAFQELWLTAVEESLPKVLAEEFDLSARTYLDYHPQVKEAVFEAETNFDLEREQAEEIFRKEEVAGGQIAQAVKEKKNSAALRITDIFKMNKAKKDSAALRITDVFKMNKAINHRNTLKNNKIVAANQLRSINAAVEREKELEEIRQAEEGIVEIMDYKTRTVLMWSNRKIAEEEGDDAADNTEVVIVRKEGAKEKKKKSKKHGSSSDDKKGASKADSVSEERDAVLTEVSMNAQIDERPVLSIPEGQEPELVETDAKKWARYSLKKKKSSLLKVKASNSSKSRNE